MELLFDAPSLDHPGWRIQLTGEGESGVGDWGTVGCDDENCVCNDWDGDDWDTDDNGWGDGLDSGDESSEDCWVVTGLPVWWARNPRCRFPHSPHPDGAVTDLTLTVPSGHGAAAADGDGPECECRGLELRDALADIHPDRRDDAIGAHMRLLAELIEHAEIAEAICNSSTEHLPVCPACVLHPVEHSIALDEEVAEAGAELARAGARWGLRLGVPGPSAGT